MPQKKICDSNVECRDNADENECNLINYGSVEVLNKHQNRSVETQNNWEQKMLQENKTGTSAQMKFAYVNNCGKLNNV